jgi:hypothetical protein
MHFKHADPNSESSGPKLLLEMHQIWIVTRQGLMTLTHIMSSDIIPNRKSTEACLQQVENVTKIRTKRLLHSAQLTSLS